MPDETARLGAAQNAVKAAVARVAALTDKTTGLNARLAELQLDADALQRSLADAQRQQVEAEKATAVVRQAVGAQAPAPGHAASTEPALPTLDVRVDLARQVEAFCGPEAEAAVRRSLQEYAVLAKCTSIAEFPMAGFLRQYLSAWLSEAPGATPTPPPAEPTPAPTTAAAAPTRAASAPAACEPVGDSRLKPRESSKPGSLAAISQAQIAKGATALKLRLGGRATAL